jgi:hypothetical protein
LGGDEPSMKFAAKRADNDNDAQAKSAKVNVVERHFPIGEAEEVAHKEFLEQNIKDSIWLKEENLG